MNEFELIEKFFGENSLSAGVQPGIGDDCALLDPTKGKKLAVSVDTLVADVHFPSSASAELIAQRALRVCLSDLAAMAAKPRWFTLALTMPDVNENWLSDFSKALFSVASEYDCELVGGDTTKGPLSISIQVMGEVEADQALLRSTAKAGDSIYVTGSLGDAAAALAVIQEKLKPDSESRAYFLERYYRPDPRFKEAQKIKALASAAIDISDGLLADLGHICQRSGVGAVLDLACLPFSAAMENEFLQKGITETQREAWALSGGDDYELCFTVSQENCQMIDEMTLSGTLNATAIGKITEGVEVRCYKQDQLVTPPLNTGYQHFAQDAQNDGNG